MPDNKKKVIVILGRTASGKTSLSIKLAQIIKGEIISADSRQIYKGLDLGTGKITKKEMQGIPHHLIDIEEAKNKFSVSQFKELALEKIKDILERGKTPIICGGTGLYMDAIVNNTEFPTVKPNEKLRQKLEKKETDELVEILENLDKKTAERIDKKNRRRLIRAIEIATELGKVPALKQKMKEYKFLQIGIETDDDALKEKIEKRLIERIRKGMIKEAEKLHEKGLTFKRMEEIGLEYRYLAKYLKKEISREEMIESLKREIWRYAKRQKTWFKRNKQIKWFYLKDEKKIISDVKKFLRN